MQEVMLHTVANTLKANNVAALPARAEAVMAENKAMSKELEDIKAKVAASKVTSLFDNAETVGDVKIASAYFTGTSGDTPTVTKGSNGKALIAYFSKTGTTQRAAEEIQKLTGADMFRIEPVQAYPEEYQRTTEIARDELNQNARTQVKGKVDDMAQYDTIFVGYPIWWMEPPMPVLTFLESYDLNGKTVIPFATSASSGIDGTLDMLRSSAKGANVTEGLRVTSNDEIQPWLQKIGVLK